MLKHSHRRALKPPVAPPPPPPPPPPPSPPPLPFPFPLKTRGTGKRIRGPEDQRRRGWLCLLNSPCTLILCEGRIVERGERCRHILIINIEPLFLIFSARPSPHHTQCTARSGESARGRYIIRIPNFLFFFVFLPRHHSSLALYKTCCYLNP